MIKEIETMLRKEFPNEYSGIRHWTNQSVMLAILEAKNISSNLLVSSNEGLAVAPISDYQKINEATAKTEMAVCPDCDGTGRDAFASKQYSVACKKCAGSGRAN